MTAMIGENGRWDARESQGATGRKAVGSVRDPKGCLLCERPRRGTRCENRDRAASFLGRRRQSRAMDGLPRPMAVCKDCCIGLLEGHRCAWWNLCWGV